jgi:mRNA-degrading endonuclease RelE of RelBE toxin-antitoxin system
MSTQPPDRPAEPLNIDASPEFKQAVRKLKKRYRNIGKDIGPVIEQIQKGELVGDQIAGTGFVVYKVRVKNQDIQKGKSAGYRIIYQLESQSSATLLLIYSKSDMDDLSIPLIQKIIAGLEK